MMKNKHIFLIILLSLSLLVSCGNKELTEKSDGKKNSTESVISEGENTTESENGTEIEATTETVDNSEEDTSENVQEQVTPSYTYVDLNKTMYAKSSVNVRDLPTADGNKVGELSKAQEVIVTGQCNETGWYRIDYAGNVAYVSNNYLVETKPIVQTTPDSNAQTTVQPSPEPEMQTPVSPSPETGGQTTVQPTPDGQFPGPDSDNVFENENTNYYEENKVVVRPKYLYWNNGILYAECYVVNGCSHTVSEIEVETLAFANDSVEIATGNFGELVGVTIPAYSHIVWTFVFPADCVITPNADLYNLYYYSNVYFY